MIAEVRLRGRTIGAVSMGDGNDVASFQYDFAFACAKAAGLKRGRSVQILDEVIAAVKRWPDFAAEAKLDDSWLAKIQRAHRLSVPRQ